MWTAVQAVRVETAAAALTRSVPTFVAVRLASPATDASLVSLMYTLNSPQV